MKFLIVFALFAVIANAVPVVDLGENVEAEQSPLTIDAIVDFQDDGANLETSDIARPKRQFGGFGFPGGYGGYGGGYGRPYGGFGGNYGNFGGYGGHHHHHRGHGHWGK